MKPLIIFGAGCIAKLAYWYFENMSQEHIAAFCVDDKYYIEPIFCDIPVIKFSELYKYYGPSNCKIFVALGYQELNKLRRNAVARFKELKYEIISCVSPYARIMNNGNYGINCFIMDSVILEPYSRLGDCCMCWCGSIVTHESEIGSGCFLGANCVVGGRTRIGENTFLGINSTVRNEVVIGDNCVIGASTLVMTDLPDETLVAQRPTQYKTGIVRKAMHYIGI